ncbi:glycosylphosphatidylinositol anchor biosynthesis [Sporothrix curviconia]|uniref:Glycosylphosphatidylinositol anchor biosynthesis n=1 Tax=Sporothrix curviconia TaxID=1260050 RepID=A0ABP0BKN6_9PEZI
MSRSDAALHFSHVHRPRPLALSKLNQDAVPFNGRALAWSPDAELAVVASDSVYIYVPQFTSAAGGRMPIFSEHDETLQDARPAEDDRALPQEQPKSQFATGTETRNQFASGFRRIPIGYPRLDHRLNHHLFSVLAPGEPGSDTGAWQDDFPRISAGSGPISGSGSSMNSVVSIAWSPSGVGHNRRSILGVLTASGMLILYGEPLEDEQKKQGAAATSHGRSSYDTSLWEVLWAVGERLAVPGQKRTGECIISFAWTGGCDSLVNEGFPKAGEPPRKATQAFLVYQTDKRDIVVLKVSHLRHGDGNDKWHVVETSRFRAAGPHTTPKSGKASSRTHVGSDPMFVPQFTPFGLRCSPWMVEAGPTNAGGRRETALTCLIGYLAPHYVGFRRLTAIWRPNADGVQPWVYLDDQDCAGFCTLLTGNAMLEFEDGLWDACEGGQSVNKKSLARCVVATPAAVKAYTVDFAAIQIHPGDASSPANVVSEHPLGGASCSADAVTILENHTNPITGLVVHPPDPNSRGREPLYSIVRQSASSRLGWYASNAPEGVEPPEWVGWMQSRILPGATDSSQDDEHMSYRQSTAGSQIKSRMRIWGLDQAPGGVPGNGGVTAILVTEHPIHGGRGSRGRERSHVLFGSQPSLVPGAVTGDSLAFFRPVVSTEAAMWSYMYGNGPGVLSRENNRQNGAEEDRRSAANQTCSICEDPIAARGEVSACTNGHTFDRCTGTGLAIQKPNVSQACGVCGRRTLFPDALEEMIKLSTDTSLDQACLQAKLLAKVCGFCGGKFYE